MDTVERLTNPLRDELRARWHWAKHDASRHFEMGLNACARRLPWRLRRAVVVTVACESTDEYPGEVTALEMMQALDRRYAGIYAKQR